MNTAFGNDALYTGTMGQDNTALGSYALESTSANSSTASGRDALAGNTSGAGNTAVGDLALEVNSGSFDIAAGFEAGLGETGSNNIDIGSQGATADSGVTRIGAPGAQKTTYIAAINTTQVTGSAVYVTAGGQLGVLASSERYKTDIAPMGRSSEKLEQLRPVSFYLKTDPRGSMQYGLIAEEVDAIYPELVIRDSAGAVQGVRYDELSPLLLNEVQQLAIQLRDAQRQLAALQQRQPAFQRS